MVNAFGAKERSKFHSYHILLNALWLLIFGLQVAKCVSNTLWQCTIFWFGFSFWCLSNIFLLARVTDNDIYEVKTISSKAVFQFKCSLNVFKGVVIIYQVIVAAFTPFITTVKRTLWNFPVLVKCFLRLEALALTLY